MGVVSLARERLWYEMANWIAYGKGKYNGKQEILHAFPHVVWKDKQMDQYDDKTLMIGWNDSSVITKSLKEV
jgi:hypothetical protein